MVGHSPVSNLPLLFRRLLSLLLLSLFLWQTAYSVNKYLAGATTSSFVRSDREKVGFPALSFCPMAGILEAFASAAEEKSFAEAVEDRPRPEFLHAYAQADRYQR